MKTEYREFEQDWHARIEARGHRVKYEPAPWYMHKGPHDPDVTQITYPTEAMYAITMAECDLDALVRVTAEHDWHAYVQKRYPQLREAYMNYLTQVYLTIDPSDKP